MTEKTVEDMWEIAIAQQKQIDELIRVNEAHENNIGRLWEKIADLNHYTNQLESKQASLENDIYSLQTTVNRLEGV